MNGTTASRTITAELSRPPDTRPKSVSFGAALAGALGRTLLIVVAILLVLQWIISDDGYLSAETGLGYYFAIVGVSAMVLLLSYSARKRFRFMRRWGATQNWFRVHMMLGLLGPALLIAHSNFKLGSTNSTVALFSMLLVAASGVIGRFIYTRIHFGLYGMRADIGRLGKLIETSRSELEPVFVKSAALRERLAVFEGASLAPPRTILHAVWRILSLGVRTRFAGWRARRLVAEAVAQAGRGTPDRDRLRQIGSQVDVYLRSVRKAAELSFWERMFALWHLLHIPLFFMMILTAVAHVLAVHIY